MVHTTCAALHCRSTSNASKDLKFHQFPHDAERRKIWIIACKRSDVIDKDWDYFKHKYVCSLHFQKCMYTRKNHLKKSAVPSLNLSEKPLQHDSFTQTAESIQYLRPYQSIQESEYSSNKKVLSQNNASILYYGRPNVEKSSTTTHTQTEHSFLCDIGKNKLKHEMIPYTKTEKLESFEQDVEMKTENDDEDENSDFEIKTEIVENEILPLAQSTQFLQSDNPVIMKDGKTIYKQAERPSEEIDHGKTATNVNKTESSVSTNSITMPRKMDDSTQTDKVIVLNKKSDGSVDSINPEDCKCNTNVYDMPSAQFYRVCSNFLPEDFCTIIRRQMYLDGFTKNYVCSSSAKVDSAAVNTTNNDQRVEPLELAAACDIEKEDWDVTVNDYYDHVKQWMSDLVPQGSIQDAPSSCRAPVSNNYSGLISTPVKAVDQQPGPSGTQRSSSFDTETEDLSPVSDIGVVSQKHVKVVADGSEIDSDFDEESNLDLCVSIMAGNIPHDDVLEDSVANKINSVERIMDDAIDQLVGGPKNYKWQAEFGNFQGVPEEFSGPTPGTIENYDTPYDAFTAIWSKYILELIAYETNRYATRELNDREKKGTLKPVSFLRRWTHTDENEIYILFAIYILMGLDPRPSQHEFWSSATWLDMPQFRILMSYRRFLILNKFLHFENISNVTQNLTQSRVTVLPAKLRKIAPIAELLNNKFSNLYNLHTDIAIHESLTLFKGLLSWEQAIRAKAVAKSFELCDSRTGYLYKFEIYLEENNKPGHYAALAEKSTQIIVNLLKGLETRGHCVMMDNYYNSPALARYLKSLGFDCLGALRQNRRNVPMDIKSISKKLADRKIIARHCGDVSCIAWQDTKMVTMISTYHNDKTFTSRSTKLDKPVVLKDYTDKMVGLNQKNQELSAYFIERKERQKWYIKIFKRLLIMSTYNAYILLKSSLIRRNKPVVWFRKFQEQLAYSLVANHRPKTEILPLVDNHTRLRKDMVHVPKYYDKEEKVCQNCCICYRKGLEKKVYSSCATCNQFICFENCWSEWHSKTNISINDFFCQKRKCPE